MDLAYPVIGILERRGTTGAYVAWHSRDLRTCPLHEFLRTRASKHVLVARDGSTHAVRACRLSGLDLARVREVGVFTQVVSALFSLFNVPVRISLELEAAPALSVERLKDILQGAVSAAPQHYTARRTLAQIHSRLARASTFVELAESISNVRPIDARHSPPDPLREAP